MSKQTIEPAYMDGIFGELSGMEVHLDADPLAFGPKRLNGKIAETRRMLARCERLFLDVSQKLSAFKRDLRRETLAFDMKKKHLLANEPRVRAERSVSDRDAAASMMLKTEIDEVHRLEAAVADLEDVLTVVKAKRTDLKDTQGRLKDQIRLCQDEIGLGNRWGSKVPGARPLDEGLPSKAVLDEVDEMFASLGGDGETNLLTAAVPDDEVDEEVAKANLIAGIGVDDDAEEEEEADDGEEEEADAEEASSAFMAKAERNPVNAPIAAPAVEVSEPEAPEAPEINKGEEPDEGDGAFNFREDFGDDSEESDDPVPTMAEVLPGTVTAEAVDTFLDNLQVPSGRRRREQEDEDRFDIDDILSHFTEK